MTVLFVHSLGLLSVLKAAQPAFAADRSGSAVSEVDFGTLGLSVIEGCVVAAEMRFIGLPLAKHSL